MSAKREKKSRFARSWGWIVLGLAAVALIVMMLLPARVQVDLADVDRGPLQVTLDGPLCAIKAKIVQVTGELAGLQLAGAARHVAKDRQVPQGNVGHGCLQIICEPILNVCCDAFCRTAVPLYNRCT